VAANSCASRFVLKPRFFVCVRCGVRYRTMYRLAPLALVSAWGLTRGHKYLKPITVTAVTAASLIVYVPDIDLRWPTAKPQAIPGWSTVTDGRGRLQQWEFEGTRGQGTWAAEPIDAVTTRAWQNAITHTAELTRQSPWVAFGFRHFLYNKNSIQLDKLTKHGETNMDGGDPTFLGRSEDAYFTWLTNDDFAGRSCLLFTSEGSINEITPLPDTEALTRAARRAGFRSLTQWTLPDGRDVVAWHREPCHDLGFIEGQ
jgi:hypothetical protein